MTKVDPNINIYICPKSKNTIIKKIAKYLTITLGLIILAIIILGGGLGSKDNLAIITHEPFVFAHRGVAEFNVENSKQAFDLAKEAGFNAIEVDVNITKDGKLIIFHDNLCSRLLHIDDQITNMTWPELETKYLQYRGKATKNKIYSLDQFLENQNDSIAIYLDMKQFSMPIIDTLISTIQKYESTKDIIIADGNIFYLAYLKSKNPSIITALEGFNKGKEWLYYILPKNVKPDFYASKIVEVDHNHMSFLLKNNLVDRKIIYGVNHKNISDVYALGLFNIIYDYHSATDNIDTIKSLLVKNKYHKTDG